MSIAYARNIIVEISFLEIISSNRFPPADFYLKNIKMQGNEYCLRKKYNSGNLFFRNNFLQQISSGRFLFEKYKKSPEIDNNLGRPEQSALTAIF